MNLTIDIITFFIGTSLGGIVSFLLYKRYDTLTALLIWHDTIRARLETILTADRLAHTCYNILLAGLRANYLKHYDIEAYPFDTGYQDLDEFLVNSVNKISYRGTMAGRLASLEIIMKAINERRNNA